MQEENTDPSSVEAETTQPEVTQEAKPDATQEAKPEADGGKAIAEMQRRIAQLTFQREEAKRQAARQIEELQTRLKTFEPQDEAVPTDPAQIQEYVRKQVERQAREMAQQEVTKRDMLAQAQKFNQACDSVYQKGVTELGQDFESSMQSLRQLGVINEMSPVLHAVIKMENGHKVLKQLADNPMQAMELMEKDPYDVAFTLARMNGPVSPKASNAPTPIRPMTGMSGDAVPQPNADGTFNSRAEYRRWREAQK